MEKDSKNIIQLMFEINPKQWGLRGNPYLWKALESNLMRNKEPKSIEEFERSLRLAFKEITGKELIPNTEIFIEDYNKGGMSSGVVSSDFWIEIGFPLLKDRFNHLKD